jgi:hypothetical protein
MVAWDNNGLTFKVSQNKYVPAKDILMNRRDLQDNELRVKTANITQ